MEQGIGAFSVRKRQGIADVAAPRPVPRRAIPHFKWRFVRLMRRVPMLKSLAASADLRSPGVTYANDPRIDRVVFICGLHRSGTTLIEDYVHARFDVSALRADVPENEGQHLQDVCSEERRFGGPGRFAFSAAMYRELAGLPPGAETRERILASWRRYVVGDSPTLLEKSPPNLTRIAWLRATFPGARFVVMVRDPRAVAEATRKWTSATFEELVLHWHTAHAVALAQADPRDTCFIRYEDFCADPDATLALSPVPRWLAPRPWPLTTSARFARLADSNARYLAKCPAVNFGRGIWDAFGYRLDAPEAGAGPVAAVQLAG
ncbi:MAG: sulfotransferase [Sphingomonadales bacterium]|nr:sulfotransferase [Sphingomonadales bacterium]MDE2570359.1 sulfotransferase [Sphingomonadales bacterium]